MLPTVTPSSPSAAAAAAAPPSGSDSTAVFTAVAVVAVVVVLAAVAVSAEHYQFRPRRKLRQRIAEVEATMMEQARTAFNQSYRMGVSDADTQAFEEAFRAKVVPAAAFLKAPLEVARGQGGVVSKSQLRLSPASAAHPGPGPGTGTVVDVALKCCHPMDVAGNHRLLVEARLLLLLKHPAIVTLTAIHFWKPSRPWLVTQFRPNGDLKMFLRGLRRSHQTQGLAAHPLPDADAVAVAHRLAGALAYLDGRGIVHGDIAARNVLVGPSGIREACFSDFGSAVPAALGKLGDKYSAGAAMPFRWMPPEALLESTQTAKSDVWAFGVLIWEVCALGRTPYGALGMLEVRKLLLEGDRLRRTEFAPPALHAAAAKCWAAAAQDRPPAWQLARELAVLLAELEGSDAVPEDDDESDNESESDPAGYLEVGQKADADADEAVEMHMPTTTAAEAMTKCRLTVEAPDDSNSGPNGEMPVGLHHASGAGVTGTAAPTTTTTVINPALQVTVC